MTRINSAIPVKSLTDEHLLAEHREISRLPWYLQRAIKSGSINRIPEEFTLGTGHVMFFLDKMQFVWQRYKQVYLECVLRHFAPADMESSFVNGTVAEIYFNDYKPTEIEKELLIERISKRIIESPKPYWHYYGKIISKGKAVKMLNK